MDSMPDIGSALQNITGLIFSFGSDFFAFLAIVALVAAFAFYFGRDRLVPLIAGTYAALALYTAFPYFGAIGASPYVLIGLFVLFVLLATLALSGIAGFFSGGGIGFIKVAGLSILASGLLMAIAIHNLPMAQVYTFSAPTLALFSNDFHFWWLVAPLVGAFFLGK